MNIMARVTTATALSEAQAAIRALGPLARAQVGPSALDWFGHWLGWPDWFLAGTSIPPGSDALPPRISVADDLMIVGNIIDHGVAPDLLQRIASGHLPSVGPISMMAQTHSPTLGDFVRFLPLTINYNTTYLTIVLTEGPEQCSLVAESPLLSGSLRSFIGLLAVLVCGRALTAGITDEQQRALIETDWPIEANGAAIAAQMPMPIRWGSSGNRLTLPAAWMGIRNPWHDEGMWLLALERAWALEASRGAETQVARLRETVAAMLTKDRRTPRLKQVAARHGMSERSLGRLLAAGGTSFQAIVDDERRSRAALMINDPAVSLSDLAEALGFPDVSSFGRSFRRWFGQTPGQFRRRHIATDR
jgi:AraC-like DNA-binding protein